MLNFYPILPFLGPCFPPTIPIVFDTNFIFESFWVQIFTPKENNATTEIKERVGRKKWCMTYWSMSFLNRLSGFHIFPEEN